MLARVGQKAPDFSMPTTKNIEELNHVARLADYCGKWLILLFYPLDFTCVCSSELKGFNARLAEFNKLNAEILGVSTDSVYCHRAWITAPPENGGIGGLGYPLASDLTKQAARDYGVLIEEKGIALRGLFIIDPDSILRYQVISDEKIGRSVDETLRVLQALQRGGMCPLDWRPGDRTL